MYELIFQPTTGKIDTALSAVLRHGNEIHLFAMAQSFNSREHTHTHNSKLG